MPTHFHVFSVAYMGPAVTTYQGLNLGFRIYTMDGDYDGTTNVSLNRTALTAIIYTVVQTLHPFTAE